MSSDVISLRGFPAESQVVISDTLTSASTPKPVTNKNIPHTGSKDLTETVHMSGAVDTGKEVKVTLTCNGKVIATKDAVMKLDGSGEGVATFPGVLNHVPANSTCNFTDQVVSSTTTTTGTPPASLGVTAIAAVGSMAVCGGLLLAGISAMIRRENRAATERRNRLAQAYDVERRDVLRTECHDLMETWLDYDRDISKLLTRPAMRNYSRPATAEAAEAMIAASDIASDDRPDLETFAAAVSRFRRALSEAEYEASVDAKRGMSEHERRDLRRAQQALALALDGGATEPERMAAYRLVSIIMRDLGVEVSQEIHETVIAQIEGSSASYGQIEGSLSAQAVLKAIAEADYGQRPVLITTRVRRAGERDVTGLTAALGQTASHFASEVKQSTPVSLAKDYADIDALRNAVRDVVAYLEKINRDSSDLDVRNAATQRLSELGEALRNADMALGVGDQIYAPASH